MKSYNIIKNTFIKFRAVIWLNESHDPFESDAGEGFSMFQGTNMNLFRIRIFLRFLVFRKTWADISLPLKIFALIFGLATASGAVLLTKIMIFPGESTPKEDNGIENQRSINSPVVEIYQPFEQTPEIIVNENNETEIWTSGNSEKINTLKTISYHSLSVLPDTAWSIRYSSFGELYFENFRFVDFRPLYKQNKPLLIPALSGTEAQYENRDEKFTQEKYLMADTIGYTDFLAKIADNLNHSNYAGAERLLFLLAGQRPDDENGLFYRGYIHYCRKEYEIALNFFLKCENSGFRAFYDEARLYRANIYYFTGKTNEALTLIESIDTDGNPYKAQAAALKIRILNNTGP